MDLALKFTEYAEADIVSTNGVPEIDDGFETAIYISLFTDLRADDDDDIPDNTGDRRGWWANSLFQANDRLGSKLWLLSREKTTAEALARAKSYSLEALAWLKKDGAVNDIKVAVERAPGNLMMITVSVYKGGQVVAKHSYEYNWASQIANPVHKRSL